MYAFSGVGLFAQDAVSSPTLQPVQQQVTVTATRSSFVTEDAAASVRTLDAAALQQSAGFTLDDHLRQLPGVELYRRTSGWVANPTTQGISLRGLGSTAASRTLVLSDEVPFNDPFGGWVHWNEMPALAVDSVTVVRGGASDLYGSSAIGGVVEEVPVSATQSRRTLQAGYGGLDTRFVDGIVSASHAPWSSLFAGSWFNTGGYITVAPEQRGLVDRRAGVAYDVLRAEVRRGPQQNGAFLRGNFLHETRHNGTAIQTNATQLWRYQAGADQVVGRAHFFERLYGSRQGYRQSFSTIAVGRSSEALNLLQRVPSEELGASAQGARSWSSLTALGGFDIRDVRATDQETRISSGAIGTKTSISARQRATGGYGELLWQYHGWSAAFAARVDDFRTFDAVKWVDATRSTLARTDEVLFSPHLGLVYRFSSGLSLSGSVYRAFRGPTLNELYRSGQVGQQLTLANDALRSERATGFEFGAQKDGAWGTVRTSYFWTEVNRPITALTLSQTSSTQTLQRVNLGQIRSRGVSMDLSARVTPWLQLSGGYQYAVATVTRFAPQPSLVGNWIPEVARHMATAQVRLEQSKIGSVNLVARESGRLFDDASNLNPLRGYFRLDVDARRSLGRYVDVSVQVQNLLDRRIEAGRTPTLTLATPQVATIGVQIHRAK